MIYDIEREYARARATERGICIKLTYFEHYGTDKWSEPDWCEPHQEEFMDLLNLAYHFPVEDKRHNHLFYVNMKSIYLICEEPKMKMYNEFLDQIRAGNLHLINDQRCKIEMKKIVDYGDQFSFTDWLVEVCAEFEDTERIWSRSRISRGYVSNFVKENCERIQLERNKNSVMKLKDINQQKTNMEEKKRQMTDTQKRIEEWKELERKNKIAFEEGKKELEEMKIQMADDLETKDEKIAELEKLESKSKQKNMFFENIENIFEITGNIDDCVSKKIVCNLAGMDYTSKRDIRDITSEFKKYNIEFDRYKMLDGMRGAYKGLKIKTDVV